MHIVRNVMGWIIIAGSMSGCDADPVSETHSGALESGDPLHPKDQSFYDEYTFKADEGWQIQVTMESTAFDTYLQLRRQNLGDTYLQEVDDMAPGNTNSQITVVAPASDTYVVWANSVSAGMTGAYTLRISAQPPGAAAPSSAPVPTSPAPPATMETAPTAPPTQH